MKQQELIDKLYESHISFTEFISSLTVDKFTLSQNEKWTAGQQLDHIYISVKPLTQILKMPKFILKLIFGQSNRPSKAFDELVTKYHSKLQTGGQATGRFVPKAVTTNQKEQLIKSLTRIIEKLITQVGNCSEQDLDKIVLPHPLLGKLTLREMIYFTIYHVGHHHQIIKRTLNNNVSH